MSSNFSEDILKLLPSTDEPLIARKAGASWPALQKWNLDYLAHNLNDKITFRMGQKKCNKPQWECDAIYIYANVYEFQDWVQRSSNCSTENPFWKFSPEDWWAYAAYLHMSKYPPLTSLKSDVPWDQMFSCLPNVGESTFWLGTSGSYTACHYDTYGINFVLQIFGRKRWTLFPPTDTPCLYPTRIPLEESTVFSKVNFQTPDFISYPLILNTHPHVVILEPGDVLFVPRHWWHFVESIGSNEATCAVNMWLDQPKIDKFERCKEALTQIACFSFLNASSSNKIKHNLHASEQELVQSPNWFKDLVSYLKSNIELNEDTEEDKTTLTPKRPRKNASISWEIIPATPIENVLPNLEDIIPISLSDDAITPESIFRAFLDPEVIELVYSKLTMKSMFANRPEENVDRQSNANNGNLLLRCKSPSGVCTFELTFDSTIEDLATKICSDTGINRNGLVLRYGYPLKRINLDPSTSSLTLLSAIPIASGENIVADGSITEAPLALPAPTSSLQKIANPPSKIVRLEAPSDNCCLFTSVNFCVSNGNAERLIGTPVVTESEEVQETRLIIANIVLSDPVNFNEGVLGMIPDHYIKYIVQPDRWGGGIEVAILSSLHGLEIDVVDVLSGRIDRFGEDKAYEQRILLLYDGIHYDPIAMLHPEKRTMQTIFPTSQNTVLVDAQNLANEVKRKGQFTDMTNCNLMCSICRTPLKGQTGAQHHAKSTGHQAFQEFAPN